LRGPLGSIYSSLQILINPEYELSIEKRSFLLNELAISSSNIFDLLENLLVWANNQRGKMKVERKPCYLYEAVGESIAVFSQMAINKNINLINDVSPNQFVFADENSLNVILRNLISNAIKFSNQYTSVIVRFEKKDGRMLIWVIDQGIGMTKELLENLFRIDKKVSEAGTSGETGTGLGLILCKEFVHLNHGELFVESEPGKGSKFCISLPENES